MLRQLFYVRVSRNRILLRERVRWASMAVVIALGSAGGVEAVAQVPARVGWVNDYAAVLPERDRLALGQMLQEHEARTTQQIAVLTVQSLQGQSIEAFSLKVANAWKLGRAGVDNGVLVTLAPQERVVRIELGAGMYRCVSDDDAKRIIAESMLPAFRAGDFPGGLRAGVQRLLALCRSVRFAETARPNERGR